MDSNAITTTIIIFFFSTTICLPDVEGFPVRGSYAEDLLDSYPSNERDYMKTRDLLKKYEQQFEDRNFNLTESEVVADRYLSYLKWKEFQRTRKSGLPASLPMERNMAEVQDTEVYKALLKMPKGGNLHSHEDHQLSKKKLFEIVWNSTDFEHLFIIPPSTNHSEAWMMDFFINPPENKPWKRMKDTNLTIENLLKHNTLINLLTEEARLSPTSSDIRWQLINPLWLRASTQLISNIKIKKPYLRALMEQSVSEGIMYIESRRSFGLDMAIYELDYDGSHNKTNGKKFLDQDYESEVRVAMEIEKEIKNNYSSFVGFKRISYAVRSLDKALFEMVYNKTLHLHRKYPHHVIGFDAVAEEDSGYSSLYYVDQYTVMSDGNGGTKMPLYLHSSETSWPDDLMTSQLPNDLVSTMENSYDALLLKTKRIGHGKAFSKLPWLKKLLKLTQTAVEVCPLSNQILGMEPDLRNHFGQFFHKEGVPVVIAPDDPGTFGFDNVTLDWYAAYTGWGLELGDLKQIAQNSLIHTGMNETEKATSLEVWSKLWREFVEKLKHEALSRNFSEEALKENRTISFARALPSCGATGTKVHIYGSNFEQGISKGVVCKLSNYLAFPGTYVSYKELICKVPDLTSDSKLLNISISLNGTHGPFVQTGLNFTYENEKVLNG